MSDDLRERIRQQYGDGIPATSYRGDQTTAERPAYTPPRQAADLTGRPVTLRIPWSCLVSDNEKHVVEKGTGRRFKTPQYKAAKARIHQFARDAMRDRPVATAPLSFVAHVWMPDHRRHDVLNFGKCTIDSLTGVIFADDSQLHDVRWVRAGVDVDAPRAELTISPLLDSPTGSPPPRAA